MGLLLRPEVYYAEAPDGAYLLTHEGPLELTGASAYPLLDRVAPYLDGRHSLDELTADLTPERGGQVERLVSTLRDRGAVREVREVAPTPADGAFHHEITYLDYFREDGGEAFAAYCAMAMLVLGSGRLVAETAAAAARTGLHRLHTAVLGESATDLEDAVGSLIQEVDIVIHVADEPEPDRALGLERLCASAGVPLAQALVWGGAAWIAPIGVRWTSGWRRLSAQRTDLRRTPGDRAEEGAPLTARAVRGAPSSVADVSDLAAKAVAAQVVHGAFRSVTGVAGSGRPVAPGERWALTQVDLSTLRSATHAFRGHPFAATTGPVPDTEQGFLDRVAALADAPRLAEDDFSQRAASCVGDLLGVFGEPDERDFIQVPLHVCRVEVSDPVGLLRPTDPAPTVVGVGLDFETARYRAALRAGARYGSLMVDPRRLLTADGRPLCGADDDPHLVLTALQSGRASGRLWACRVADGRALLVAAGRVFPALSQEHASYLPPAGAAGGYDWREAVAAGLLAQCRRRTLADLPTAAVPFPRIDLDAAPLDDVGNRYRALVAAIADEVTVYDVTGPLGVPTVIWCRAGEPVAAASGLTVSGAVRDAMELALLDHQARASGQPAYAPTPPILPRRLRGTAIRTIDDDPPFSVPHLAGALEMTGHHPAVVPLDHDPEVSVVMPFTVRVVLADA